MRRDSGDYMNQDRRESLGRWIGGAIDLKTLVLFITLVVGWIGNYFTLSARVTMLETRYDELKLRYDKEVIPRDVLNEQAKALQWKLDDMSGQMSNINTKLDKAINYPPSFTIRNGKVKTY